MPTEDELTGADLQEAVREREADEQERCEHGCFRDERCEDCIYEKGHLSWWIPPWMAA